ncbi:MAG: hypothetical protein ABID61_01330 [Candidatus Micrarchaeota archaeon]
MKNLFIFILLISTIFSSNVNNAVFNQLSYGYTIVTDMQFTTSMVVSAPAEDVVSGTPSNLASGSIICPGTIITVNPAVNAYWATPDFSADVLYPVCNGAGCPVMVTKNSVSTNRNIKWLTAATFDSITSAHSGAYTNTINGYADGSNIAGIITDYYIPLVFHNQRVTYHIEGGDTYPNKEAEVAVDCKGTLRVNAGISSTTQTPTSSTNPTFTLNNPGGYQIRTQLENIDCFSAVIKHPTNFYDYPQLFYLQFYAANRPAIPSPTATNTITLNVQAASEPCDITRTSTSAYYSGGDTAASSIFVSVRNDGASGVQLTGVTSSNTDYVAVPITSELCTALGINFICALNGGSGFNTTIAPGATRAAIIFVYDLSPPSGTTTLTINAVSTAGSCGDAGTCSVSVPLTSNVFCEVDPSSADIPQFTQSRFNVSCSRLDHTPISCIGSDWTWSPSSFGTFATKTSSYTLTTPTAAPGLHGTLRYESGSPGIAYCYANVDTLTAANIPTSCEIQPPNVSYGPGEGVIFTATCTNSLGVVIPCTGDKDNWAWAGITGEFSNDTNASYTTAYIGLGTPVPSSGQLQFESGEANCQSNVTVIDARLICDLVPDDVIMNQSTLQHFNLSCTLDGDPVVPTGADYLLIPTLDGSLGGESPAGVDYTSPNHETDGDLFGSGNYPVPNSLVVGAYDTSHIYVPSLTTPMSCGISPSTLEYGPYEVAEFLVTCLNVVGDPVPCIGDNWYWDGITGGFVDAETDNLHAWAYPTSPVGSEGALFYRSEEAICFSDITVVTPVFVCDLTPNSVTMNFSTSQHFDLACTEQGELAEPDDADYYLQNGLVGGLSGESVTGVDYGAPAAETDGDVLVVALFNSAVSPILGAIDISHVTVTDEPEDECVGPHCDEGDSDDCRILGPSPMVFVPGQTEWVGIMCGPDGDIPCTSPPNIVWSMTPPTAGYIDPVSDNDGVRFTITGSPGFTGEIHAVIDADGHGCFKPFEIGSVDCWEYS